mmetsp:Transcript_33225/g.100400  ORF Transcript_33225/g.100400 Transcript_33225/m.100400 type:complete len:187 (+) Transcript_33225:360-920(+)
MLQWATDLMADAACNELLFTGDFNSTPETGVVELVLSGTLSEHHPEWSRGFDFTWNDGPEAAPAGKPDEPVTEDGQRRGNLPVKWCRPVKHPHCKTPGPRLSHQFKFSSPHSLDDMVEHSTNYTQHFAGWLDYIFAAGEIEIAPAQALLPDAVLAENVAIPSALFPSDHVPVVARFRTLSRAPGAD